MWLPATAIQPRLIILQPSRGDHGDRGAQPDVHRRSNLACPEIRRRRGFPIFTPKSYNCPSRSPQRNVLPDRSRWSTVSSLPSAFSCSPCGSLRRLLPGDNVVGSDGESSREHPPIGNNVQPIGDAGQAARPALRALYARSSTIVRALHDTAGSRCSVIDGPCGRLLAVHPWRCVKHDRSNRSG